MGREASAEAVHGSVDGLDGVRGRELPLALDGAELDAAFAFGFGDTIAQQYETGAKGQGKRDGVESRFGKQADRDVAVENGSDGAVVHDEERGHVATVD